MANPTSPAPLATHPSDLDTAAVQMVQRFRIGAEYVRTVQVGHASFAGVETIGRMVDGWLPPADREPFHALGVPREEALRASRGGDAPRARALMDTAERQLASATLSPGTRLLADSLHAAAEAYLCYRAGEHDRARAGLEAALASTNALHDRFGFAGAEGRRLHLAHLLARVEIRRGADPLEVARTVCRLWDYVEGNEAAWPFAPYARPGAQVSPRMAALSLNEIVTELALLLAADPSLDARALELLAREQRFRSRVVPYPYLYARAWLTMKAAIGEGAPAKALHAAGRFLGVVDGPRPLLWYAAVRDAHRFLRTLPGAASAGAADVLASETPPFSSLPECLRIEDADHPAGRDQGDD